MVFLGVMAFSYPGYQTLSRLLASGYGLAKTDEALNHNNRNSGSETMAITILIVLRTIPERQIFTCPMVLVIVLPP